MSRCVPDRRGITLIEMLVVVGLIALLFVLLTPAVFSSRETANNMHCKSNLHQVGLALYGYQVRNRYGKFPPLMLFNGKSRWWSWNVLILPELGRPDLYRKFDLNTNAFSRSVAKAHSDYTSTYLSVLHCPSDPSNRGIYYWDFGGSNGRVGFEHSNYLGCRGSMRSTPGDGMFPARQTTVNLDDVTDGSSQTIFVGERAFAVDGVYGWWAAGSGRDLHGLGDCVLDSSAGLHYDGGGTDASRFHWWSNHRGGANFLYVDGAVRFLSYGIDHQTFLDLSSRRPRPVNSTSQLPADFWQLEKVAWGEG